MKKNIRKNQKKSRKKTKHTRRLRISDNYKITASWKHKRIKRFKRKKQLKKTPYVVHMSAYRRNLFIHLRTLGGILLYSLSTGHFGYKGRNKTAFLAVVELVSVFLKRIKVKKINHIFFWFTQFTYYRRPFKKALKTSKQFYKPFVFGFYYKIKQQFNGCRYRKRRRL